MRVNRLQAEFNITTVYRHFPLHPETPEQGLTLEELFAGRNIDIPAAKQRMARLMADEGLPYGNRVMTYNSRLAQELGAWADTQANGERLHDELFRAYFVDNINIAKPEKLTLIAERAGLSAAEAGEVLHHRRYRERVDEDWRRSRELAITAIPTFWVGQHQLVGAQPFEQLNEFLIAAGAARRDAS